MIAPRIIPCLDVREGRVVKGVQFCDHTDAGGILELAERYRMESADELVFYDITASPDGRTAEPAWVARVASRLDIPFCVAGGIRCVGDAEAILYAGADRVSVNSPALDDPTLIERLALRFGSQCVVVGIDSVRVNVGGCIEFWVKQYSGDPNRMRDAGRRTLDWIQEVQDRGAGEIVLNCIDKDGVRNGYDIEQLTAARAVCGVPLIASGGAGTREHFRDVFVQADVDGALAASVFHSGSLKISELKAWLRETGIGVRL